MLHAPMLHFVEVLGEEGPLFSKIDVPVVLETSQSRPKNEVVLHSPDFFVC